jgi:hypothetical protein
VAEEATCLGGGVGGGVCGAGGFLFFAGGRA